jgi:hypothetical protein
MLGFVQRRRRNEAAASSASCCEAQQEHGRVSATIGRVLLPRHAEKLRSSLFFLLREIRDEKTDEVGRVAARLQGRERSRCEAFAFL